MWSNLAWRPISASSKWCATIKRWSSARCWRLTGSRNHLDDLAQEVFLRLYRALPNFRGEALVTTYLYRIAVNVAQDEWKRRRRDDKPLISISDETSAWEEPAAASPAATPRR